MNKWFAGCDNVKLFELHKNRSFMVIESIAFEFLPAKQMGLEVNTMIGSRNTKSIELSSSDDPTWVAD